MRRGQTMLEKHATECIEPTEESHVIDRRAAITAAAAAGAGMLASLALPSTALATDSDPVLVGQLATSSTAAPTIDALNNSGGDAVNGKSNATDVSGVYGENLNGFGVKGTGDTGVWGHSTTGDGVFGEATGVATSGVYGENWNAYGVKGGGATGVWGFSTTGDGVYGATTAVAKSGVYGQNWSAYGVKGSGATGVWGFSTTGDGVLGETEAADRSAVYAEHKGAAHGYAVYAKCPAVGKALKVDGKMSFTRSGVSTFPRRKSSIYITVPGGLVSGVSKVMATMQGSAGSGVYISYACRNNATTIKVRLNKKSTRRTKVAWMVID